jgi:hypothetical protein
MPTAIDSVGLSNISASTAAFKLKGGRYGTSATATGTGTFGLQRLALDGSTWIPVHTAFTTGQNCPAVDLPGGSCRIAVATVTAIYFEVGGITEP